MGTGKEQHITITSSSNLTEDEIDQKVREAEAHAEEDKKKKEAIEIKNNADSVIYASESALKDVDGKISDDDKKKVEDAIEDLKSVKDTDDLDAIKSKTEALQNAFQSVSEELYKQAQAQAGGAEAGAAQDDDVVDADYEVVDEDDK